MGLGTQIIPGTPAVNLSGYIPYSNDAFIIVKTTNDPAQNGDNLRAAYLAAAALTPNGLALSAENRAVCIVPPGVYDLGDCSNSPFALALSDYVDLIGLTPDREAQWITGTTSGGGASIVSAFLTTTGDCKLKNLTIQNTSSTRINTSLIDSAVYYDYGGSSEEQMENVWLNDNAGLSWSTRLGRGFAGKYVNVLGGDGMFGGYGGNASGIFRDCIGGVAAFGGGTDALGVTQGIASGNFLNCVAGDWSFGGDGAASGQATGIFVNCVSGDSSFAIDAMGLEGMAVACRKVSRWTVAGSGIVVGCMKIGIPDSIVYLGIPTSDPASPGQMYHVAGALMVSL